MATPTTMNPPVPFPDYLGSTHPKAMEGGEEDRQHVPSSSHHHSPAAVQPPLDGRFYSTTTEPLRDHTTNDDVERNRTTSTSSSTSILNRPRPKSKPSNQSLQSQSQFQTQSQARPSSFFGVEGGEEEGEEELLTRPSGEWQQQQQPSSRQQDQRDLGAVDSSQYTAATEEDVMEGTTTDRSQSRSSFYGLEPHIQQPNPATRRGGGGTTPNDTSPSRTTTTTHLSSRPQTHNSSGSGSGSYTSSNEIPPHRPRYSQAPYAASRAASLYGGGGGGGGLGGDSASMMFSPAPLMDQSHLQPGTQASLLSHDKTLELYRQNAKKTNDANIQFEFCAFVMEVVSELEQADLMEKMSAAATGGMPNGGGVEGAGGGGERQMESRKKQKALVQESITLLNKLAQRGHVKSQYFLADCYTQGIGTPKGKRDYDKAFPLFMLAGKHGHADASFRAAQCLEHGWGCRKDQSKAVSLYRRAAVLSHPGAMHRLGLAEINGELGLTKRPKDGVQWLKRAAELADQVDPPQPQSLHELAVLHEKGIDNVIFQDEEYAAELLARASELQYAPSAYKLGECYEYGRMGCPQDAALSIHYYNIAAQQNHPAACFALTAWYLVGSPGVLPQSDTEAYLWAKKAAQMDFAKAEYACGYFTESGIGTYQDQREALEWFRKAASHGDKRAQDRLRNAGQPIPTPVVSPQLRNTASSNALNEYQNNKNRSQANTISKGLLTKQKNNGAGGGPNASQYPRSGSVDRLPRPPPKDVKGKGREQAPSAASEQRPGFTRQRSNSQPHPVPFQYRQQQQQQQQPPNDFSPLPYGTPPAQGGFATVGSRPQFHQDGGRSNHQFHHQQQQGGNFLPLSPDQVRMPLRQQVNGGTSPLQEGGGRDAGAKKLEKEHVLQRRKNGGAEDKDCVVM